MNWDVNFNTNNSTNAITEIPEIRRKCKYYATISDTMTTAFLWWTFMPYCHILWAKFMELFRLSFSNKYFEILQVCVKCQFLLKCFNIYSEVFLLATAVICCLLHCSYDCHSISYVIYWNAMNIIHKRKMRELYRVEDCINQSCDLVWAQHVNVV